MLVMCRRHLLHVPIGGVWLHIMLLLRHARILLIPKVGILRILMIAKDLHSTQATQELAFEVAFEAAWSWAEEACPKAALNEDEALIGG